SQMKRLQQLPLVRLTGLVHDGDGVFEPRTVLGEAGGWGGTARAVVVMAFTIERLFQNFLLSLCSVVSAKESSPFIVHLLANLGRDFRILSNSKNAPRLTVSALCAGKLSEAMKEDIGG